MGDEISTREDLLRLMTRLLKIPAWLKVPHCLRVMRSGAGVARFGLIALLVLAISLDVLGAVATGSAVSSAIVHAVITLTIGMVGGGVLLCCGYPLASGLIGAARGRPLGATVWRTGSRRAIVGLCRLVIALRSMAASMLSSIPALTYANGLRRAALPYTPFHLTGSWDPSDNPHLA